MRVSLSVRRDTEIDDLRPAAGRRMQEDWIEEVPCGGPAGLKEATGEIKQLKQVIDTVKNNLIDKDKGLQSAVDISIQNKKLETLLLAWKWPRRMAWPRDGAAAVGWWLPGPLSHPQLHLHQAEAAPLSAVTARLRGPPWHLGRGWGRQRLHGQR